MSTVTDADTALLCAGTPRVRVRDQRGLMVRALQYNRCEADQPVDERITQHRFTAAGHLLSSIDPRLFSARQLDDAVLPNFRYLSSLSGRALNTLSQDAGQQVAIHDAEGAPVWKKNGRHHVQRWTYDVLHRPLELREEDEAGTVRISERFIYGEAEASPAVDNNRGRLVRHYDTAGLNEMPSFSTSGKALRSVRRLLADPIALSDWVGSEPRWQAALEKISYDSRSSYNALGMVERSIDAMGNAQQQSYDLAGQLAGSSLTLKGEATEPILREITYSAAGKVLSETACNGIATDYAYEPQTQRLSRLRTTRPSQPGRPTLLQAMSYTYDPVGNILSISDAAVSTRFHDNQRVEAASTYTYDAMYQLLGATGRESANAGLQTHALPSPVAMDGDPSLLSNYTRRYTCDRGGNLTCIRHQGQTSHTSEMLISPTSNHAVVQTGGLSATDVEGHFDACGNLRQLMPGQPLNWDKRNQLRRVTQVHRAGGLDDDETYQYDGGGMRIRKTTTALTSGSARTAEALYLPGIEIRRTRSNATTVEELHVITLAAAGRQAVRVLHWATGKPDDIPNDQWRCSLGDQIGSSLLELDRDADILTLEAYYPYGGTAILSGRNDSETKYKFVRYSGKERDATGLYYYGFRYYSPWLGRWLNPDPAGPLDGLNLMRMAGNSPITLRDTDGRRPTKPDEKKVAITKVFTPDELGVARFRNKTVRVQDITFETMQVAAEVISDVTLHMKYGRGNQMPDIERTGGESYMRIAAVREAEKKTLSEEADLALAYQAGNCGEYATMTMLLLASRLHPHIPLEHVADTEINHGYVLAGDRRNPNAEVVVVDNWALLPVPHLLSQGVFTHPEKLYDRSATVGKEWGDEVWDVQPIRSDDSSIVLRGQGHRPGEVLVGILKNAGMKNPGAFHTRWLTTTDPSARFRSPHHAATRFDQLPISVVARYKPSVASAPQDAMPIGSRLRSFFGGAFRSAPR